MYKYLDFEKKSWHGLNLDLDSYWMSMAWNWLWAKKIGIREKRSIDSFTWWSHKNNQRPHFDLLDFLYLFTNKIFFHI